MSTKVHFWEVSKGSVEQKNYVCFGNLSKTLPSRVVYLLPIDQSITKDETLFYLNFLDNILNKSIYRHKIIEKSKNYSNHLMFTIQTKGLVWNKGLLYLTAFRYLDEYPEIVKQLFEFKNTEDLSDLFNKFQKLHFDYEKTFKGKKKQGNLSGHGLISYYFERDNFTPISLQEFSYNLNERNLNLVHTYFKSRPTELGEKYKNLKFSYTKIGKILDKKEVKV